MSSFKIEVDISEVADLLKTTRQLIEQKMVRGIESVSLSTHGFILRLAKEHFKYNQIKMQMYLGLGDFGKDAVYQSTPNDEIDKTAKRLTWVELGRGLFMVSLDPKAEWLEDGGEPRFMDWLLKGKSAKTAKDGTKYAVIPFRQTIGSKIAPEAKAGLAQLVKNAAKKEKISLSTIEYEKTEDGVVIEPKIPRLGILHKLQMKTSATPEMFPSLFSRPRGPEESMATGLPQHPGIFKVKGAVVTQRLNKKGKPTRETVVFRVISEKHRGFRWMTPREEGARLFEKGYEFAKNEIDLLIKDVEQELNRRS